MTAVKQSMKPADLPAWAALYAYSGHSNPAPGDSHPVGMDSAERIVTRPDFDGIVCAVLLKDALKIDAPVYWVEPNEIQKGRAAILSGDVIANLPFDERCAMWFDHHYTNRVDRPFRGAFGLAPSAARMVYEYFKDRMHRDYAWLVHETDAIDSANLTESQVLHPERYPAVLLSMTIKGPNRSDAYWDRLVDLLLNHDISGVLADPVVGQRCRLAVEENLRYKKLLKAHTRIAGHVSITDFRSFTATPTGNRFLVFSLFPETVVNMKIHHHDTRPDQTVVHVGHSIFNRGCRVNVGLLLSRFEGGGHHGAGAATFSSKKADDYLASMIDTLMRNVPIDD
jgi:hypothetical protein